MFTLENRIVINAPMNKIWEALTEVDRLDEYDPTVLKSTRLTDRSSGKGAKRKVDMKDGKNWFEEECVEFEKDQKLVYKLSACSFPVHELRHSYYFNSVGDQIEVMQKMQYQMKYGIFGKLMGAMMKSQWNKGINQFLGGLKGYSEK